MKSLKTNLQESLNEFAFKGAPNGFPINFDEDLDENFTVSSASVTKSGLIKVSINGQPYTYEAVSGSPREIMDKFEKMLKYSSGRALAFLKSAAKHVGGGKLPLKESNTFNFHDIKKGMYITFIVPGETTKESTSKVLDIKSSKSEDFAVVEFEGKSINVPFSNIGNIRNSLKESLTDQQILYNKKNAVVILDTINAIKTKLINEPQLFNAVKKVLRRLTSNGNADEVIFSVAEDLGWFEHKQYDKIYLKLIGYIQGTLQLHVSDNMGKNKLIMKTLKSYLNESLVEGKCPESGCIKKVGELKESKSIVNEQNVKTFDEIIDMQSKFARDDETFDSLKHRSSSTFTLKLIDTDFIDTGIIDITSDSYIKELSKYQKNPTKYKKDIEIIENIIRLVKSKAKINPIVISRTHFLLDGYHRLIAYKHLGIKKVWAYVEN